MRATLIEDMDAERTRSPPPKDMDLDDLADLLADLPEAVTQQLLHSMDQQDRERLSAVLSYRRTAPAAS